MPEERYHAKALRGKVGDYMTENEIAKIVIEVGLSIHRTLGPGLFESVYETVLAHDLRQRGLNVKRQEPIPLLWKGLVLDDSFRADIVINDQVIIELKSLEKLSPVHKKQLLTYLRIADKKLGLLLNFGASLFKEGIERIVNGLET